MRLGRSDLPEKLERLFGDCDFSNDLSAVDRIVEYYEVLEKEDLEFIEDLVDKLPMLAVDWPQPPYQRVEGSITRLNLDAHSTERFTYDEDKLLWENWKCFQKDFNVPNKPQIFARWRNKGKNRKVTCPFEQVRGLVTAHLARGLRRSLHQVYKHFVFEYAYPVKGAYSPLEERIMEACFENYQSVDAVVILSKVLGREPRGIYKRYKIFSYGKAESKCRLKWTLEAATKFINLLVQHYGGKLENLRDRIIDKEVWLSVQGEMDIPYDLLKRTWYRKFHVQCFLENSVTTKQIRRLLYKILSNCEYKRWRDIRWREVATMFPRGCTAAFLHDRASHFAREYCPEYLHRPLEGVLRVWSHYRCRNNQRLKLLRMDAEGKFQFRKHPDSVR